MVRLPGPLIRPFIVSVVPPSTSRVPPPAFSVVARPDVNDAVVSSMPPSRLSGPAAAPRLASLDTCTLPALIAVPPL
ncbi:hypothetical protein DP49_5681 [Burkholderia pseudomallei]|nr:hypothetical protein DP49_5681 [Burkholderia pseudomallei]